MSVRRRLDAEVVRRGLAADPATARSMVEGGKVLVGGSVATNAGRMVDGAEAVLVQREPPRFVGRGGEKLEAALEGFGLDPSGLAVLDAGASTGGFTDCLLQRGAERVVALDVGHGQMHERLRADPRVWVLERTNLRRFDPSGPGPFDAAVADLSFISLRTVMAVLLDAVRPGAWLVLLVKPQFEAERREVSRGAGVVNDPGVWARALSSVSESATDLGAVMMGAMVSPLRGAEGNVEFLMHLVADPAESAGTAADRAGTIEAVVATAAAGRQERSL